MKKIIILTINLIFFTKLSFCCLFSPYSFCTTSSNNEENVIVFGKIVDNDQNGINIEIIELLRGNENRNIIRIWDGTDFDCNGFHSMAAIELGQDGDSIIIILPKIDSIENTWEVVIGDYRVPDFYGFTTLLEVKNNIVKGLIEGISGAPNELNLLEFELEQFINSYVKEIGCDKITNTHETVEFENLVIYPNPFKSELSIKLGSVNKNIDVHIYNLHGKRVYSNKIERLNSQISLSHLLSGIYLLEIRTKNRLAKRIKIVKIYD